MKKIYIFVSHSHKDIEKVRILRNVLEKNSYEPLLFFLKCLSKDDEIDYLIKREIDSRNWFIYCKSKNSIKSKWVKSELDYQKTKGKKNLITIDLDKSDYRKQINDAINRLDFVSRIFISFSYQDRQMVERIRNQLINNDFDVVDNEVLSAESFLSSINKKILNSTLVLLLLTKNASVSKFVNQEIRMAIQNGKRVIPLVNSSDLSDYQVRSFITHTVGLDSYIKFDDKFNYIDVLKIVSRVISLASESNFIEKGER